MRSYAAFAVYIGSASLFAGCVAGLVLERFDAAVAFGVAAVYVLLLWRFMFDAPGGAP